MDLNDNLVDMGVQVGSLRFANPILTAAGTFGYGVEFAKIVDLNRLGGVVTKGVSKEPLEGAPLLGFTKPLRGCSTPLACRTSASTRS